MLRKVKSIIFVICVAMVFSAQTYRIQDKEKQSKPQAQVRPTVQSHKKVQVPVKEPVQVFHRASPTLLTHVYQPSHREKRVSLVRAVVAPAPVENNRFLHRQHHNNWQPRYNFYGNRYHFYPYVNIAAAVELSGGYMVLGPDGQNYYYDRGTFYVKDADGEYVAVPPPIGIIVNPIAPGARQIIVNNQVFWRYKGVFYVQVAQGFQVVGPVQMVSDE